MGIRKPLLTYLVAVVVLAWLGWAFTVALFVVAFMGALAMDSPTSTAGPTVNATLTALGFLRDAWFAPARAAFKLMGVGQREFVEGLGPMAEPVLAALFWALLVPLGLYLLQVCRRRTGSRNT